MATIVVGVDGSDGAQEALRVALEEAKLRGARLRVISAWHISTMAFGTGGLIPDINPTLFEESTNVALDAAIAALGEHAHGVEIERVVRRGQAAQVLVDEARGADLLFVGSRGHGGIAGLLLGSVSHQCAMYAPCPVVIVHDPSRTT
jgi:nucleotide-binding universal stress UspA family protein